MQLSAHRHDTSGVVGGTFAGPAPSLGIGGIAHVVQCNPVAKKEIVRVQVRAPKSGSTMVSQPSACRVRAGDMRTVRSSSGIARQITGRMASASTRSQPKAYSPDNTPFRSMAYVVPNAERCPYRTQTTALYIRTGPGAVAHTEGPEGWLNIWLKMMSNLRLSVINRASVAVPCTQYGAKVPKKSQDPRKTREVYPRISAFASRCPEAPRQCVGGRVYDLSGIHSKPSLKCPEGIVRYGLKKCRECR
jgi:hypothetical protein